MRILLAVALILCGLAGEVRAAAWPDAPFPAPTNAEIDRVAQYIQQNCPALAVRAGAAPRCPKAAPDLAESRRIVEVAMLGGAVEWCGDITHRTSIVQTRVRSDGSAWDAVYATMFVPALHGAAKGRGKALMQAIAPGGCSAAEAAKVLGAYDRYLAADVAPEAKRWPAVAALDAPWPLASLPRPTDAQVTAFDFAAAGCLGPLTGEYGQGPKDNGASCQRGLRLSLGEARRVVELGLVSGAVRWCDPKADTVTPSSPWMATLGQVSMTSAGGAWDPAIGQAPSLIHGLAQGMARRLLGARGKACSATDRAAASQALLVLVQRDAEGGAVRAPVP
jgi:hypothetical protein